MPAKIKTLKKLGFTHRQAESLSKRGLAATQAARVTYWLARGFLIEEAWQFKKIGKDGRNAPYIQSMVQDRMAMRQQADADGISRREYRKRVADDYASKGISKRALYRFGTTEVKGKKVDNLIWDYFTWYEDNRTPPGYHPYYPKRETKKKLFEKERQRQTGRLEGYERDRVKWQTEMDNAMQRRDTRAWNKFATKKRATEAKINKISGREKY